MRNWNSPQQKFDDGNVETASHNYRTRLQLLQRRIKNGGWIEKRSGLSEVKNLASRQPSQILKLFEHDFYVAEIFDFSSTIEFQKTTE